MKHLLLLASLIASGCARSPDTVAPAQPAVKVRSVERSTPPEPARSPREPRVLDLGDGLVADLVAREVSFPGRVAWDFADPAHARTYLEAIVCRPDTKEHESLVVAHVPARAVHAALLAIGLEPGGPGSVQVTESGVTRQPPTGPGVTVVFVLPDGSEIDPRAWVVHADSGAVLGQEGGWVFAGSTERTLNGRVWYAADIDGVVVGLHTFGTATLGFTNVLSPDSGTDTPEWIAKASRVPPYGTPITVKLRADASPRR